MFISIVLHDVDPGLDVGDVDEAAGIVVQPPVERNLEAGPAVRIVVVQLGAGILNPVGTVWQVVAQRLDCSQLFDFEESVEIRVVGVVRALLPGYGVPDRSGIGDPRAGVVVRPVDVFRASVAIMRRIHVVARDGVVAR